MSHTQVPLVLPRDNTTDGFNVWNGGLTHGFSNANAYNNGWNFNIQSVFLRNNHFPAIDIAGTRGFAWYLGGNAIDMANWLSHKFIIYSNTILFNKVKMVLDTVLGEGMALSIELEDAATPELKAESANDRAAENVAEKKETVIAATATVTI